MTFLSIDENKSKLSSRHNHELKIAVFHKFSLNRCLIIILDNSITVNKKRDVITSHLTFMPSKNSVINGLLVY